ncbi:MAG: GNAT family N-acetyltransferase [Calditrichaeota bacterium]|nr:GNAT family N-acetyltransferase [Calditrichota bacterium]
MPHIRTPFLRGKKVVLRAAENSDTPDLTRWMNDPDIYSQLHVFKALRDSDTQTAVDNISRSENRQAFSICLHDGELIGAIWLNEINWVHRNAMTAAFIGSAMHRGKGYGVDAKMLLCYHCFCTLNLHKLISNAHVENVASLRYNAKCGYKEECRRREHHFRAGKFIDFVETGLLRSEWLPIWEKYRADDPDIRVPEPK